MIRVCRRIKVLGENEESQDMGIETHALLFVRDDGASTHCGAPLPHQNFLALFVELPSMIGCVQIDDARSHVASFVCDG